MQSKDRVDKLRHCRNWSGRDRLLPKRTGLWRSMSLWKDAQSSSGRFDSLKLRRVSCALQERTSM